MQTDDLFKSGMTSWNLGNPKEAGKIFDQVLALDPNHEEALVRQGNVLGRIGKYAEAITFYNRALNLDPKNTLALVNKGLAHHYIEQYEMALGCYEQVLMIKPRNVTALYNKSSSLVKLNRIKEALEVLSNVTEIDFSFKAKAKYDIDFAHIQKNNEFKKIIL